MAVTPEIFKAKKPQFASVDDGVVQDYLTLAGRIVDDSWLPEDRDTATIAYTCHLMTLDGLGTDSYSKAESSGTARFQTIRSGQLTLTRFRDAARSASYSDWLDQTPCGRYFARLLAPNRPTFGAVGIGAWPSNTTYAKDWPPGFGS